MVLSARARRAFARRDRVRGGFVGAGIGALVGGLGFAAATHLVNDGPGEDYWPLALVPGALGGGAIGGVVGAIVGVPRRGETASRP